MKKLAYLSLAVLMISTAVIAKDNPMAGGAPMLSTKDIVSNAVNSADHTTLVAGKMSSKNLWKAIKPGKGSATLKTVSGGHHRPPVPFSYFYSAALVFCIHYRPIPPSRQVSCSCGH
jgi:hypothetical protein